MHFVKCAKPRFLPKGWAVVDVDKSATDQLPLDQQEE
jgi:hypothetical protein